MGSLDKDEIVDTSIRSIAASHPQLVPFMEEGKVYEQFRCFLDHLEIFQNGGDIDESEVDRSHSLAMQLGRRAAASQVAVEDLIGATYLFRHAFWSHIEKSGGALSGLDFRKLLSTVKRMNEYLSQVNLTIVHEYLNREREIVARQRADLVERQRQIDADMELARRIQQSMFPPYCQFGAFKLCAEIMTSAAVGGDFYGCLPFGHPEHRVDLYIGDVQGKGVAAALIMMLITSTLRSAASVRHTPLEIVTAANRRFRQYMTDELAQFASLFYFSYDINTRTLSYAKAGHEDALLIRSGTGEMTTLSTSGYFLGIFDEADYEEKSVTVGEGDRLYLFTDGVNVIEDAAGKRLDYDDFFQIILRHNSLPIGESIDRIAKDLIKMNGDRRLKDDVGLLAVEF